MARKRMIDPSLWIDEGMAELSARQQLLFIGLFSNADDEGRLKGSPVALRLILPTLFVGAEDAAIAEDLGAVLGAMTQLVRYEIEGREYLQFNNYAKWQRIDRPSPSLLPAPMRGIDERFGEHSSNGHRGIDEGSSIKDEGSTRARPSRARAEGRVVEEKLEEVSAGEAAAPPPDARARDAPPGKTPPTEKPKRGLAAIDDAFRTELVSQYTPQLGSPEAVRRAIDKACNQRALLGALDPRKYVTDWLDDDVRKEQSHGTPGHHPRAARTRTDGASPARIAADRAWLTSVGL